MPTTASPTARAKRAVKALAADKRTVALEEICAAQVKADLLQRAADAAKTKSRGAQELATKAHKVVIELIEDVQHGTPKLAFKGTEPGTKKKGKKK